MSLYPDTSNCTELSPGTEQVVVRARSETLNAHASTLSSASGALRGGSRVRRHIDHEQVRSRERVMAELLVAARMTRRMRLSRLAEVAMSHAGQDLSITGLVATAHVLRRQCIELGMPECRYRDLDWRLRGLA